MPNNKRKSLKNIKGEKVHPYSRKAKQMHRCVERTDHLSHNKAVREELRQQPIVNRLMWFQLYLPPDQPHFTLSEIHQFIKAYISRHDIEMEQLRAERANLPSTRKIVKSKREELIEATKQKDESEYKTGFEVPDLRSAKTVKSLREWQGDFNAVRMIKTIRLRMDGENKGLSKSSDMITNTRNDAVSSLQNDQMNE